VAIDYVGFNATKLGDYLGLRKREFKKAFHCIKAQRF